MTNSKKSGINSPQFRKNKTDFEVTQIQITRYDSPLVPEMLDCVRQGKVTGTVRRIKLLKQPECLGQMAQRYCRYCSERCPITALCVMVVMGEHLCRDLKKPLSEESTEALEPLPAPKDEQ